MNDKSMGEGDSEDPASPVKRALVAVFKPFRDAIVILFQMPGELLRNVYLLRMPLLLLLVMLLFPITSWATGVRSLTIGAYEMRGFWTSVLAGVGFCSAALSFQVTSGIIRSHGLDSGRIRDSGSGPDGGQTSWGPDWLWRILSQLMVFLNVSWLMLISKDVPHAWMGVLAGVAGYIGAYQLVRRHTTQGSGPLAKARAWMGRVLVRGWLKLTGWENKTGMPNSPLTDLEEKSTRGLVSLLLLFVVGWLSVSSLVGEEYVPPVFSVFTLLALATYLLSALSFWLDQFRVPVITVISAYCATTALWKASDHYYRIWPVKPGPSVANAVAATDTGTPRTETEPVSEPVQVGAGPDKRSEASPVAAPAKPLTETDPLAPAQDKGKPMGGPARILSEAARDGRPVIVVVMAGGGIQAAAWPVEVLSQVGSDDRFGGVGKNLHRHICMISSVSGGSVGAMYYAQAFSASTPGAEDPRELGKLRDQVAAASQAAAESSLGGATRAMLRHDLLKVLAPILSGDLIGSIYDDRGAGLEQSLLENARKCYYPLAEDGTPQKEGRELLLPSGMERASLSAWREDALAGKRPALVFNSTVVESGERLAFSTVPCPNSGDGAEEFTIRYPGMDIAMSTAARMSATFPFVSPVARPGPAANSRDEGNTVPGPEYWKNFPRGGSLHHLADGGYVDASGLDGAVQWLDQGLTELAGTKSPIPKEILLIALSGFPSPLPDQASAVDAGEHPNGALTDLLAPLRTLTSVYTLGRSLKGGGRAQMFKANWANRADAKVIIHIRTICPLLEDPAQGRSGGQGKAKPEWWQTEADLSQPPLSWHLRECEKQAIRDKVRELMEPVAAAITPDKLDKEAWPSGENLSQETDPRCALWDIARFLRNNSLLGPTEK